MRKDILTVSPETIIDIPIDMTIIGGKTVYKKKNPHYELLLNIIFKIIIVHLQLPL